MQATNYAVEITPGVRISNSQSPTIDHYMSDGFLPGASYVARSAARQELLLSGCEFGQLTMPLVSSPLLVPFEQARAAPERASTPRAASWTISASLRRTWYADGWPETARLPCARQR